MSDAFTDDDLANAEDRMRQAADDTRTVTRASLAAACKAALPVLMGSGPLHERQADAILAALPATPEEPRGEPDSLREAILFGPNVEFPNLPSGPRLTGPDVLLAIAHYMDRKDDEAETEAGGSGWRANRDVQAHLRAWSAKMRAALDHSKDEEERP